MQIKNINSLNFEKLIYKKERGVNTSQRQQMILDVIDKDYRQNPNSKLPKDIFDIGKYADCDVYVVAKRNGNIGLQIIEKDTFGSPLVARDCKMETEMDFSDYAPRLSSSGRVLIKNPVLQFAAFLSSVRKKLKVDESILFEKEIFKDNFSCVK